MRLQAGAQKRTRKRAGTRIVYLQYTNPAGYPPLEHSSRILADGGFQISFLGAAALGSGRLTFPRHPLISVRELPRTGSGVLLKLNYVIYVGWTIATCLIWRPRWIYASEAMSAIPTLLIAAATRCRIVYHEHDSAAGAAQRSTLAGVIQWARSGLARRADICIVPQQQRLEIFKAETGRQGPTFCVWNCPRLEEVSRARLALGDIRTPMRFYYHGSLNKERLPFVVLDALRECSNRATLTVIGYETIGSQGYVQQLLAHSNNLGIGNRVKYLPPVPRARLFEHAEAADVGLSFMPPVSEDINMEHMAGASNKAFDYMAAGQMLIVSDLASWKEMFVEPGYAIACDPSRKKSIVEAFSWCIQNPGAVRAKGELGRQRIASEWNYEKQFAAVATAIMSD